MQITFIAALTKNRVIGKDGKMPWHLPEDLKHFKKSTLGKTVLMGYRTYLSLGKALPQRRNIVLSSKKNLILPGCEVFSSIDSAFGAFYQNEEVMVIGGGDLFHQLLPMATKLILTLIESEIAGDTYFPEWDAKEWREVSSETFPANEERPLTFQIVEYLKK